MSFVSFAAVTLPETTEELLSSAESVSRMRGVMALCEGVEPHKMHLVARSLARQSEASFDRLQ